MNRHVWKLYQKILIVALFVFGGGIAIGYPVYGYADVGVEESLVLDGDIGFVLESYLYDVSCAEGYVIIRWESEVTENITHYRLHRRTITGYTDGMPLYDDHEWITSTYMVAVLDRYSTIDANIEIGVDYNYRLYGFDQSRNIISAKTFNLNEVTSFHCMYLPMIYP